MQTSKRTVFGRKPRNTSSEEKIPEVKINSKFIAGFKAASLDRSLQNVLMRCEGEITFVVSATGGCDVAVRDKSGRIIADSDDVQRLGQMTAFVNSERKTAVKEDVTLSFLCSLAAFVEAIQDGRLDGSAFLPKKITDSFKGVFRNALLQFKTLATNVAGLTSIRSDGAEHKVVGYFTDMAGRIRDALCLYLEYRLKRQEEKSSDLKSLDAFLMDANVPIYVFHRLTAAVIPVNSAEFKAINLLFPMDASKGLSLTFKEIQSSITEHQLGILDGAGPIICLLTDADFLKTALNLEAAPDMDNIDWEAKPFKDLAKVPILMPVPNSLIDVEAIINSIAKYGSRGYSWNLGGTISASDNLKFVGTLAKRVQYLAFAKIELKKDIVERLIPGFKAEAGKDLRSELKSWAKAKDFDVKFFGSIFEDDSVSMVEQRVLAFREVMQITSGTVLAGNISRALGLVWNKQAIEIKPSFDFQRPLKGRADDYNDYWSAVVTRKDQFLALAGDPRGYQSVLHGNLEVSPRKNREVEVSTFLARSTLSPEGRDVLKALNAQSHVNLAKRVENWLRAFFTSRFQSAVASEMAAKLEVMLKKPLGVSRKEFSEHFGVDGFTFDEDPEADDPAEEEEVAPAKEEQPQLWDSNPDDGE